MKNQCTDTEIGKLITLYELGQLDEERRESFEQHQIECDFCFRELQGMVPIISTLRNQKDDIVNKLHGAGLSFASQKQQLLTTYRIERPNFWDEIIRIVKELTRSRGMVPAMVMTTVLILLLILPPTPGTDNPYLPLLSFQKAPYRLGSLRGPAATEAQQSFESGMEKYLEDHFNEAVVHLREAVELNPDEGKFWLYLGISHYLNRQAEPAIEALTIADSLTEYSLSSRTRWYLAQAYLLADRDDDATPILVSLASQKRDYAQKADSLLTKIQSVSLKN